MKLTNDKWLRAAKCITVCILATALPLMAHAQAVSTTTVQGTVYLANGQPGAGTLQLSWPAFTTAADQAIAAGRTTVTIGADGFVSVNLAPNLGSWPAGLYYTAVYYMSDGTTSTEYWVVPAATQTTIAQVRTQVMPAAQALQAVDKAYVDQAIQSAAQGALSPTGGTLSGPLYLSSDPTQTMQAADKHYVDIAFGQAVPLTGGTLTGPINVPTLNASVNGQINIMAPGLGASDNTCTGDDTAALLAAQALARTFAVNGVRPATIYFPPGCYNISPTSGWWQGVSMTGGGSPASNGNHGVIIKQTVPGADVISAVDPSQVTSTYFNSSWSISHLTLVVNDGTPTVTHAHRWPGRWFDDASMTAGSPILKTTNGGVTCGDTGQAISVAGAGSSGALVSTILSVYPCWAQSGSAWQKITLAANAVNTVTNAHTYISVANLPVTTNIGAAGIALDGYDGKQADWPSGSVNTSSSYSHIDDVTIVSASYANHGQNNSVGIYTQGYNINYALKVHNSNFNRLAFGIVQQTAELNSFNASSNGDYQSWRDIQTNGDDVPFIAANGETAAIDNWENNSTPIGFQVYRMPNSGGDTPDGWVLSNISGGGSPATTLGWNIAGNDWTVTDVALGNNAYIDTTYSTYTNILGYSPNFGGNSNTFLGGNQFTGTPVNGSLGSTATILGANSLGMPNSKYFPMIPYKGSNPVAERVTSDFIADGNSTTTPYNHDDLFLWPSDMMANPYGLPQWGTYYTADSTAATGATWNFVSGGLGGSNFQQFDGPGGTSGELIIGTNVPEKNLDISLSAKCDSSTTYGFKAAVFGGTATHTATGSCTTAFQTIGFVLPITSADLTHNLYFAGTTANNLRVQWIDIQPQTNADTASALSAASALPNGTTATTQTAGDNTTKVATDAFVLANGGGSGSGTVNSGTAGQLAYYGTTGTAVGPLTLGTNLSLSGTTLNATGGGGSTYGQTLTYLPLTATASQTGKLVEYYFDEGSGQSVVNHAFPISLIPNYLPCYTSPAACFDNSSYWTGAYVQDSPYGATYSSDRLQMASGQTTSISNVGSLTPFLPAGNYVFSVWAKATSGTSKFRLDVGPYHEVITADLTATSSWQLFSTPFTMASAGNVTYAAFDTDSTGDATDVEMFLPQINGGSQPLPLQIRQFDMVLGPDAGTGFDPTWNAYGLNSQGGAYYVTAQTATPRTLKAVTVYAVVQSTGATSQAGYAPILESPAGNLDLTLTGQDSGNGAAFKFDGKAAPIEGVTTVSTGGLSSPMQFNDGYWHFVVGTYDGNSLDLQVDGLDLGAYSGQTGLTTTVSELFSSEANSPLQAFWPGNIAYLAVYENAQTQAQQYAKWDEVAGLLAPRGITFPVNRVVVCEGDSITDITTAAAGSPCVTNGRGQLYTYPVLSYDAAVYGSELGAQGVNTTGNWMTAREAVDSSRFASWRTRNILTFLIGANDMATGGVSASTMYANMQSYITAMRALTPGLKVVCATVLPRTYTGFNAVRDAFNTLMYGNHSFCDALADYAANPTMGPDAAASNLTYYQSDGTHPTAAGQAILAPIMLAAVNSVE